MESVFTSAMLLYGVKQVYQNWQMNINLTTKKSEKKQGLSSFPTSDGKDKNLSTTAHITFFTLY